MANVVTDTFTEPGVVNINLTAHTPEVGGAYVEHPSYADDITLDVVNDYIFGVGGVDFGIYYNNATPLTADYISKVTILVVSNAVPSYPGTGIRVNTGANTLYYVYFDQVDLKLHLRRVLAGVVSEIGVSSGTHTINNAETHTISLQGEAALLTVKWDDVTDFSVSDSNISAVGKSAVVQYANGGQQITLFQVDDIISGPPATPFFTQVGGQRFGY